MKFLDGPLTSPGPTEKPHPLRLDPKSKRPQGSGPQSSCSDPSVYGPQDARGARTGDQHRVPRRSRSVPHKGQGRRESSSLSLLPRLLQNPAARRGAGGKRERERSATTGRAPPARRQVMSANWPRGAGAAALEAENTGLGRQGGRFSLPRSAPPSARPPGNTSPASRSSFSSRGNRSTDYSTPPRGLACLKRARAGSAPCIGASGGGD